MGRATPLCNSAAMYSNPSSINISRPGASKADTPPVFIYNTGENHWDRLANWPLACERAIALRHETAVPASPLSGSAFINPPRRRIADTYVSDPAKPVPYLPRPVHFRRLGALEALAGFRSALVADRTDVLDLSNARAHLACADQAALPVADLFAATTGTDADWVVKLIDVYPDEVPSQPEMGGYELAISMDIFRGRYRESFEHPSPVPANKPQRYRFALPTTNHVFLPGHRIMVQIQSTWFPLYDRNPQTFVDNVFFAKPSDYAKATETVYHSSDLASAVWLPVVNR